MPVGCRRSCCCRSWRCAAARLYAADALGALAGGALFSLVLVRWCGVVQSMGVLLALVGVMLWSLRAPARSAARWPALLVIGGGLLVFADGRRVLRDLAPAERFDLVVVFAQSPTNAAGNRFFTQEFYDQVRAR